MSEFIDAILSPVNLVLTVFLVCIAAYWLLVIFGTLAPDALDIDLDFDGQGDLDGSVEPPVAGGGGLSNALRFFNIGEVPLMVLLTIFIAALWFVGIATHPWVGGWSIVFQLLSLVPMIAVALLTTKLLTQPFKGFFSKLKESELDGQIEVVGQRCRVISATIDHRFGQVEVQTGGAPLKLNAKTAGPGEELKRGDEVVVVADRDTKGLYTVRGF